MEKGHILKIEDPSQVNLDFSEPAQDWKPTSKGELPGERNDISKRYNANPSKLIKTEENGWCILEDLTNKIIPIKIWYENEQLKKKQIE